MNASAGWLAPEAELCLAAVTVDREAGLERVRTLANGPIGPERLSLVARKNRVTCALGAALEEAGAADRLPDLHAESRTFDRRGALFTAELGAVLRLAEEMNVEVLPYKGPALAVQLYRDPRERMFKDVDLLLHGPDVAPFARRLAERGYACDEPTDDAAMAQLQARDCEVHLRHPVTGLLIELHWHVLPGRHGAHIDLDAIWERARLPIEIASVPARGFELEDLLVLVALHGGLKHRWMRLQVVVDMARFALAPGIDWEVALERARALQCETAVLEGAFLAWCVLGAPLPEQILARAAVPSSWDRAAFVVGPWFGSRFGLPTYGEWRATRAGWIERARGRGVPAPPPARYASYLRMVLAPTLSDRPTWLPHSLDRLGHVVRPVRILLRQTNKG
ncbi:MAG: nucleotidyltransferase family protein [bacterium]|nr:nucleotidyltransferase family protein [bacterium]